MHNQFQVEEAGRMMDLAAVAFTADISHVKAVIKAAKHFRIGTVCFFPAFAPCARALLADAPNIRMSNTIGFPSGAHKTPVKVWEVKDNIADGCTEVEIVSNIGFLKSGMIEEYERDIVECVKAARDVPAKVIIETEALNDDQLRTACDVIARSGAKFLKTSTGWYGKGCTPERVALIRRCLPDEVGIRVSFGVRSYDAMVAYYQAGARRFGVGIPWIYDIFRGCGDYDRYAAFEPYPLA